MVIILKFVGNRNKYIDNSDNIWYYGYRKKVLVIVLTALLTLALPAALYAAEVDLLAVPEQYCTLYDDYFTPITETYDYYYDCGNGTHKYVYGYNMWCGGCGDYLGPYDMYEDLDGTPHSYDENGMCYCGAEQSEEEETE